ncbi:MAG TPA: cbb3-type cytochrome c oxidase subunit II [Opitutus sp.]|nr:cbb3-type cytochrome c oxidase subunit II [Opitutus sp.]
MRNGFLFFIGLFCAAALSWAGVVLWPHLQMGSLVPYVDETEGKAYPLRLSGIAAQGQMVYDDLGCAACHTQQVRRPGFGSDKERGWGDRQTVARDYIYETHVQLGDSRLGPDLANVGGRKTPYDAEDLYKLLYAGSGAMPAYKFLFEQRSIADRQPSDYALALRGNLAPAPGTEVVPTMRARALVTYLLSLNHTFEYPEARPVEPTAENEGEAK